MTLSMASVVPEAVGTLESRAAFAKRAQAALINRLNPIHVSETASSCMWCRKRRMIADYNAAEYGGILDKCVQNWPNTNRTHNTALEAREKQLPVPQGLFIR